MTTGDETSWGPNGIMTKSLASFRAAVEKLRALIARQAAAILRLLNHLADPGGGAAPAAIAAGSAPAPAALEPHGPPGRRCSECLVSVLAALLQSAAAQPHSRTAA